MLGMISVAKPLNRVNNEQVLCPLESHVASLHYGALQPALIAV